MVYEKQNRWAQYLSLAEWWYNSNWHSSIKSSPFEALYGYSPPQLALGSVPKGPVEAVNEVLKDRQATLAKLKSNLEQAQARMKQNEDKHRSERKLSVGDWVFLKLQPYRQVSVAGMRNHKLSPKYYGPFEVIEKIGEVAYKLNLPPNSQIHPVFHVSQLKKKIGDNSMSSPTLPIIGPIANQEILPQLILARRMIKHRNAAVAQVLVQWQGQAEEDATWEDYSRIAEKFPNFIREDTNFIKGEGMQRGPVELGIIVGNSKLKWGGEERSAVIKEGQPVILKNVTDSGTQKEGNGGKRVARLEGTILTTVSDR